MYVFITATIGISLSLDGVTYSPNDIVAMETLGSGASGLVATTTHRPCCTADGNWFLPGSLTELSTDSGLNFYQTKNANGQVSVDLV